MSLAEHHDEPGNLAQWELDLILNRLEKVESRLHTLELRSAPPLSAKLPNGTVIKGSVWSLAIASVTFLAYEVLKIWAP